MNASQLKPDDVLEFWFNLPNEAYFTKSPVFDAELTDRFGEALKIAGSGGFDDWCKTLKGTLALVILLDQFSRNIHRDAPEMFATDGKALDLAKGAIAQGAQEQLSPDQFSWLAMPFMHSEDLADQEQCIALCQQAGLDSTTPHAVLHADIIRKFGRFPHRNELLNRQSTADELKFLKDGGFAG